VLFLHHQVHLVDTVKDGAVLFLVIVKGFEQPDQ
jgi:hypothetical protein